MQHVYPQGAKSGEHEVRGSQKNFYQVKTVASGRKHGERNNDAGATEQKKVNIQ